MGLIGIGVWWTDTACDGLLRTVYQGILAQFQQVTVAHSLVGRLSQQSATGTCVPISPLSILLCPAMLFL